MDDDDRDDDRDDNRDDDSERKEKLQNGMQQVRPAGEKILFNLGS